MALDHLTLSGSAFEQGLQHGKHLYSSIQRNLVRYFDRFQREVCLEPSEVRQRALLYADAISKQNPAYYEGMQGIAKGSGIDFADIAALNVRYEILYYEFGAGEKRATDGCTAFALAPEKSHDGHLFLGENWDWIPGIEGALISSHNQNVRVLAYTEAGIFGEKIGLNSFGLGLAINGLTSLSDDWSQLYKPFHVRCYEILRSADFSQACAVVESKPRACSSNFLIAQAPNNIVSLEAAPQTVQHLSCTSGVLTHANHFSDPQQLGIREGLDDFHEASCHRSERLLDLLNDKPSHHLKDIQEALRDHKGHPNSVCRHEDPHYGDEEHYHSVVSIIMDLNNRQLWISDGPPCQNAYQDFILPSD